jgi:hypothetical protein
MFLQAKLNEKFHQMEDSKKQAESNGAPNDLLRKTDQFPASPPPKPKFQPQPIQLQLSPSIDQRSRAHNSLKPEKFHSDIGSLKVKQMNFPGNESFFFPE